MRSTDQPALHYLSNVQTASVRPYTVWRDSQIFKLLRGGRRTPKEVATILHIEVAVIYKAVKRDREKNVPRETSTEQAYKNPCN